MNITVPTQSSRPAVLFPPLMRLVWLIVAIITISGVFYDSLLGMVEIWSRSGTFTHGFFVVPIVLFLVWQKRSVLTQLHYTIEIKMLPVLFVCGSVWFLAHLLAIAVLEQLAVVAMIPVFIWFIYGWQVVHALLFPLLFLFFAVPIGEELVPSLMQLTAFVAVFLLKLTGIPVYSDGTFFIIPSGDWSVVSACSGVRYLIASVFLGVLYAYFSYRAVWRRSVFVALSIIVPLIANGVRAYLIVMIAHWSDMQLAVGIDHLIYGWVFFGLVMFILFAVGHLWTEPPLQNTPPAVRTASAAAESYHQPFSFTALWLANGFNHRHHLKTHAILMTGLVAILLWPLLIYSPHRDSLHPISQLVLPTGHADWSLLSASPLKWTPRYLNTTQSVQQGYQRAQTPAVLTVALYAGERGELINSENVLVAEQDAIWRMPAQQPRVVTIAGTERTIIESRIEANSERWLVWHWYWVNGVVTTNAVRAKLAAAFATWRQQPRIESAIFIAVPLDTDHPESARLQLHTFANDMWNSIELSMSHLIKSEPQ